MKRRGRMKQKGKRRKNTARRLIISRAMNPQKLFAYENNSDTFSLFSLSLAVAHRADSSVDRLCTRFGFAFLDFLFFLLDFSLGCLGCLG